MQALITNIQGYSIHDGPGIRTLVFVKGCSLHCQWCANPEGISPKPELGFNPVLCKHCGLCMDACGEGALIWETDHPRIDRSKCTACGDCAAVCRGKAISLYGEAMTVEQVFDVVRRDKMFYDTTGGVTVSGGEPLLYPDYVKALFDECHKDGINTCIETSGCANTEALISLLPVTDHVLFDIKHMDPEKHRQHTGQSNALTLANAKLLAESGVDFLFRMPLIPGVNDDTQNIEDTANFLKSLGERAMRIQLMPFHQFGEGKYTALDKPYLLQGMPKMAAEQAEEVRLAFEKLGIECSISS